MRLLSLFSGIGGFDLAFEEIFGKNHEVYYSEIDKYAIQVYQKHFPNAIPLGDITQIDIDKLPKFDWIVGGSPCQDLSIAKKDRQGLDGSRSGLFWKFAEIIKKNKPKYFILENVNSMPKEAKQVITDTLGVEPVMINASLVSAQNRKRLFWCNFPVTQPEDRGILLKDILENGEAGRLKSYCIDANYYKGGSLKNYLDKKKRQVPLKQSECRLMVRVGQLNKGGQGDRVYSIEGKSVNLSANGGGRGAKTGLYAVSLTETRTEKAKRMRREYREKYGRDYSPRRDKELKPRDDLKSNTVTTGTTKESLILTNTIIRKLTPIECARLQCFPDNWCEDLSNTRQYKGYGNAVNIEVVKHIFKCVKI